ncbi:MAG TPA: hypothetical protein PK323_03135 [Bacteroidia bacterium]|nr:hypothetical protein [Bacteroidia bacterium]
MKKKVQLGLFLTTIALLTICIPDIFAAGPPVVAPPPPPGGGGPPCWPPPCVPIDGGIGVLFAAGLALGGRKLIKSSKKDA